MPAPLIGVTTSKIFHPISKLPWTALSKAYSRAVIQAGGIPVLLPNNLPIEHISGFLSRVDGVVFSGGGDIEPARFGGKMHMKVKNINPKRDEIEIQLATKVIETGKPFLGICRGLQVVNVAMGGSLYTHIPDQVETSISHANPVPKYSPDHLAHEVEIQAGSLLGKIVGEAKVMVNSRHHQASKDLGKGLKTTALAHDGIIEAVEVSGHPFGLAVQWHPESLPEDGVSQVIFRALVDSVKRGVRN